MRPTELYELVHSLYVLITHADDVAMPPEVIAEWQWELQEALMHLPEKGATKLAQMEGRIRFCLPHELDRTQCSDVYDHDAWTTYHENRVGHAHGPIFPSNSSSLSYARDLSPEVTGKKILATRTNPLGVLPEIANTGHRRCVYIGANGRRCKNYTSKGVLCNHHSKYANAMKGYLMSQDVYKDMFKNETVQQMYQRFMESDARDVTSEIAVMRTMLGSLLRQLPKEADAEKLPIELLGYIVKLTDSIAKSIDRYDKMQQRLGVLITPEQLNHLLFKMLEIIKGTLDLKAEQYITLAEKMATISINTTAPGYLELGNGTITAEYGEKEEVTAPVKFSNACTRYRDDGEIRQVPVEAEQAFVREQQEYMVKTGAQNYRPGPLSTDPEPMRTTVGGREVAIGDDRDPYCV